MAKVKIYIGKAIYCHENGEFEGFVGPSFSNDTELMDKSARGQARKALESRGVTYDEARLFFNIRSLRERMTQDQIDSVEADWNSYLPQNPPT